MSVFYCASWNYFGGLWQIYPRELELKKEITRHAWGWESFLDIYINIEGNKFYMKLFDKIDAFPFSKFLIF